MNLPAIGSRWKSPQGILVEVKEIHQRSKQTIFFTLEILPTKRRILRDVKQFENFTLIGE